MTLWLLVRRLILFQGKRCTMEASWWKSSGLDVKTKGNWAEWQDLGGRVYV